MTYNVAHVKTHDALRITVFCLHFRCKEGYMLATQTDVINCQSDGTWSKHSVRCQPIPCSLPTNLTHVVVTASQLTPVGGTVTISCMTGFYLEGAALSECEVCLDFCI